MGTHPAKVILENDERTRGLIKEIRRRDRHQLLGFYINVRHRVKDAKA